MGEAPALVIRCHESWNFSWEKQRFGCVKVGGAGSLGVVGAPSPGLLSVLGPFGFWGTNRAIEVGGRVLPDDKRPLANCHIK